MDNKSRCENCHHYRQYYIKNTRVFSPVSCGHCTIRYSQNKKQPTDYCEKWENSKNAETRKQNIIETLESMSRQLEQLTHVLQDEMKS